MLWYTFLTGLLIFVKVTSATHLTYSIETYSSVMTSLLSNYSSKIRPIKNQGGSLQMSIDLFLANINDISTTEQKMTTTGYLKVKWTDELLVWNSTTTGMYWMQFNQVIILVRGPCISVGRGRLSCESRSISCWSVYMEQYKGHLWISIGGEGESCCFLLVIVFPF